ncbi:hypothetical protein L1987_16236 [Smallanthus sonchifolius]|uniref:Uncharacterized protein n=1 Tax=Smallanthus sonchifolius TaxID=185202 RepID=A0ACB9J9W7_9ASTR|nr:hypothetical protein L1987_16236 [Smallanthus sonchifolius]
MYESAWNVNTSDGRLPPLGICHFGFVRFSGVDDKWALEKAMRGINMKNARLSVNLAKFDREGNSNNGKERKYQETRFKSHQSNQYGNGELKYKEDRPYLNAVLRSNRIHQHIQDVTVPDDADYDVVQWYDKSVLGSWPTPIPHKGGSNRSETQYHRMHPSVTEALPDWSSKETETSAEVEISATGSVLAGRRKTERRQMKRPRVEKSNDDPFQIDDIINGSGKIETDARKIILKQKIPDPNSSMGASPVEDMEIQTENDGKEIHGGHEENKELEEEIKATIEIGQMLRVDLRSKDELVRTVIQEEENRKGLL